LAASHCFDRHTWAESPTAHDRQQGRRIAAPEFWRKRQDGFRLIWSRLANPAARKTTGSSGSVPHGTPGGRSSGARPPPAMGYSLKFGLSAWSLA